MHCDIYKSSKRDELYIYIATAAANKDSQERGDEYHRHNLALLPADIKTAMGRAEFVMHLDLAAVPKLARVSIAQVIAALQTQQYFIQLPPDGLINKHAPAPEGLRGA